MRYWYWLSIILHSVSILQFISDTDTCYFFPVSAKSLYVSTCIHFDIGTLQHWDILSPWTFWHVYILTQGLYGTGTFWHRHIPALWYFGTGIFHHMEVLSLGNFGTIQSNMYVLTDILAPVAKCVTTVPKCPFCRNIHVPKCVSAEMSLCLKVPVPKYPCAETSLCQKFLLKNSSHAE